MSVDLDGDMKIVLAGRGVIWYTYLMGHRAPLNIGEYHDHRKPYRL